jgi:hypothetical protein
VLGGNISNKHCNDGLDNRCGDEDGEIRRKRSDTLVGTLRREYGENFAEGFRSDAKLSTVLRETNSRSLLRQHHDAQWQLLPLHELRQHQRVLVGVNWMAACVNG